VEASYHQRAGHAARGCLEVMVHGRVGRPAGDLTAALIDPASLSEEVGRRRLA